ncbi:MAG: hypothetical protein HYW65_02810 [Candidatus Liptonbacteria bacterium]|nr:hypothetical protein [Candidatus Liptonbacteria bacterium]
MNREGYMHIVVFIVAVIIGIAMLLFLREKGISHVDGGSPRLSPALISGPQSR